MIRLILSITLLMAPLFFSTSANAGCYTNQGGAAPVIVNVAQPEIIVQRDTPVGATLATINTPNPGTAIESCDSAGYIYYEMSLFTTPSSIAHVYNTNLPGVGVMASQGTSYYFESPAYGRPMGLGALAIAPRTITFVKTGPTTSGLISSGMLIRHYGDGDGVTSFSVNFIGSTVTSVACSINTPNIQVPLEDVSASDLVAIGTVAKPKGFNLGLECDAGARINAKLTGVQNTDSSTDGVLQLSGTGDDNVATGVGVQILYNNQPVKLNNIITLKTSNGGQETFPFTAQYYQTKTDVTAGSANATATLELTYQ